MLDEELRAPSGSARTDDRHTIVIMGPAGAGKSTVGPLVAARLGLPSSTATTTTAQPASASMRSGAGLDDTASPGCVASTSSGPTETPSAVLACSALRPEYRSILGDGIDHASFVYLSVRHATLNGRLGSRDEHFAGAELLPSQLRTLELGDDTITVDGEQPPAAVADAIVAILTSPRPGEH
jgi:gluconokinase